MSLLTYPQEVTPPLYLNELRQPVDKVLSSARFHKSFLNNLPPNSTHMNIIIGGDHAGYQLKKEIITRLQSSGHSCIDIGPFSEDSCDYPDFAHPLAEKVLAEKTLGILICGSGNGVCITANKHKGIRAALCWNEELSALARQHNNANVLCLPARFISQELAIAITETFLTTAFEGGRHERRVAKIDA